MKVTSKATKILAAGTVLGKSATLELGSIDIDTALVATGNGAVDKSAPLQHFRQYTDATGVQTLDLGSLTGPSGEAIAFGDVRELVVENQSANSAHVLIVRPAAADGFDGDLGVSGTDDPEMTVHAGSAGIYASKPLGAPHDVGTLNTIELDFGANVFSARVVIKGNP